MNPGISYAIIRLLAFFKIIKIAFEKHFLLKAFIAYCVNCFYLIVYKEYLRFRQGMRDH